MNTIDLKIEQIEREISSIALILSGNCIDYDRSTLRAIIKKYSEIKELFLKVKNQSINTN